MMDLISHLPVLFASVVLVAAVAGGFCVFVVICSRRNDFVSSRFQTVGEVEDTIERQKQEKAALETTNAQLKDELARLNEKRAQLDKLHAELTDVEQRLLASRDALEQANKAKAELTVAQDEMERIRAEKTKLENEAEMLSKHRTNLAETTQRMEKDFQAEKAKIEQAKMTLSSLQAKAMIVQGEMKACQGQIDSYRSKEEFARKAAEEATRKSEEAQRRLQNLEANISRLKDDKSRLDQVTPALAENERKMRVSERTLSGLQKEIDRTKDELGKLQELIADQAQEKVEAEATKAEVAQLRKEKNDLVERRCEEEVALQKVAAEVLRLQGTLGKNETHAPDEDLKAEPVEVFASAPAVVACNDSEQNMLSDFIAKLGDAGLIFNRRTVNSFHTALKCQDINPLTVLAGVSGTGKTLLPIQYARFFGMMQLVISVQPRWDSPQDLFGFYNYLERKYKATDLSRLLWSYENRAQYKDRMSIVLFDEMNLARTEYYFSDFLSKLELRRLKSNSANIQLDIPQARASLPVPSSMLMVGTMNEDESTQTLSDKVLDRANVLRFGRPAGSRKPSAKTGTVDFSGRTVTTSVWNQWIAEAQLSPSAANQVTQWMESLNNALESLGRPFGYRVQEAMLEYVRQYPVRDQNAFRDAFADQIEQKILPKMRGIDTNASNYTVAMNQIRDVIDETRDGELHEAFCRAEREANNQGLFVWGGVSRTDARRS